MVAGAQRSDGDACGRTRGRCHSLTTPSRQSTYRSPGRAWCEDAVALGRLDTSSFGCCRTRSNPCSISPTPHLFSRPRFAPRTRARHLQPREGVTDNEPGSSSAATPRWGSYDSSLHTRARSIASVHGRCTKHRGNTTIVGTGGGRKLTAEDGRGAEPGAHRALPLCILSGYV